MSFYKIIKNVKEPKDFIIIGKVAVETKSNNLESDVNKVDLEKVYNDGYKSGFEDGKKYVYKEKVEQIQKIKNEIKKRYKMKLIKLAERIFEFLKRKQNDISENLYEIITRILGNKDILKDFLKSNITRLLKDSNKNNNITIYLSADDFNTLIEENEFIKNITADFVNIKFEIKNNFKIGDIEILEEKLYKNSKIENQLKLILENEKNNQKDLKLYTEEGTVCKITGNIIEVEGLHCAVGDMCEIFDENNNNKVLAEVIGYKDSKNILMVLNEIHGLSPKSRSINLHKKFLINLNKNLIGRVLDGNGNFIDGKGALNNNYIQKEIYSKIPEPFERNRINEKILTGIRAIDLFLTCGKGQRVGIFSGSGVGKSSLLGMIARNSNADINVIALIGERGREVKDFIEKDLKDSGLARSVIVASTSDKSPLERVHGALIAMTIAEYYKDMGKNVIFMMDSITRYAMALREIGLAIGEVPSTKGYTPSVFSQLPKFIERSGSFINSGSITSFFTVLVEGDDFNEPIADTMRSLLDGHIILSRNLAEKNHYPSIDITASVSRVMNDIINKEQLKYVNVAKEVIAIVKEMEDLINIGAYKHGTNKKIDYSISVIDNLMNFLRQEIDEKTNFDEDLKKLESILKGVNNA